jgi:Flp pilus assembly protein protease CpaA
MVTALLIVISLVDVYTHRIRNWSIIIVLSLLIATRPIEFNVRKSLITLVIAAIFLLAHMGMGDIKLLVALTPFLPTGSIAEFVSNLFIASCVLSLAHMAIYRQLASSMAFAPVIAAAFISVT